jgi:hypothetical protein
MTGMLKLVARMLSREQFATPMLDLLGNVLSPVTRNANGASTSGKKEVLTAQDMEDGEDRPQPGAMFVRDALHAMANQVNIRCNRSEGMH